MQIKRRHLTSYAETTLFRHIKNKGLIKYKHLRPSYFSLFPTARYTACKLELRNLVYKKREQFLNDQMNKDAQDSAALDNLPPPANWKPKGQLVAHLHEHRGAVNRYIVIFVQIRIGFWTFVTLF